jgi:hypothetical protein
MTVKSKLKICCTWFGWLSGAHKVPTGIHNLFTCLSFRHLELDRQWGKSPMNGELHIYNVSAIDWHQVCGIRCSHFGRSHAHKVPPVTQNLRRKMYLLCDLKLDWQWGQGLKIESMLHIWNVSVIDWHQVWGNGWWGFGWVSVMHSKYKKWNSA